MLVAVVAYNAWNNHRNAPKRAQPQPEPAVPDPQEVRLEPSLDAALENTSRAKAMSLRPWLRPLPVPPVLPARRPPPTLRRRGHAVSLRKCHVHIHPIRFDIQTISVSFNSTGT